MEKQQRKIIRLQRFDYSSNGCYYVTICTRESSHLFGEIVGADDPVRPDVNVARMNLSQVGQIVYDCWYKINDIYPNVRTDAFCVMPNHIHGIIVISNPTKTDGFITGGQGRPPLQKIMQGYKSVTTRLCFDLGYHHIWQRSYYDHIIRNSNSYDEIRRYILTNPQNWAKDELYDT